MPHLSAYVIPARPRDVRQRKVQRSFHVVPVNDNSVTVYTVSKAGRIQGMAGAAIIHVNPLLAICNSEYTADTVRQKGCPRSACRCHSRPYNASSMLAL
jgi:hypothetical protein